jgi:outer membrane receptor protein involved in Fe transport
MSMTRSLFALFTGASAAALTIAGPAQAQEPAKPASADEIVVTASKRSQTLFETPISVAVTTAATIERANVRDLLDLQSLVPSLRVGQLQSSANTNFIIRGFGNGANNAGIEPAVGVLVDGVYRSRSAAQISDLPNIQRVEVLRGPQSTLFGKNASAGVISIVTQEPKFEFGGSAEASYGNYNATVLKGDVTGPLSDKVAFSLAGSYNKCDGYAKYVNIGVESNDRNRWGVRGQLLALPTNDLKLRLIADFDKIDEICCTVANIFDGPTGAAIRALGGRVNSNQPNSYDSYANFASTNIFENSGVSFQADWNLSPSLALTSITANRKVKGDTNADSDFTSADLIGANVGKTDISTFTQEVRLASKFNGPLNFLVGVFYFNEDIDTGGFLTFGRDFRNYANALSAGGYGGSEASLRSVNPGLPAGQFGARGQGRFENYEYKNEATSFFGQLDFEVTDRLTLTAGLNYTDDKKQASTNNVYTDIFSSIDLDASVAALRAGGIAQTIGGLLGVPGGFASAARVQAFAAGNPAAFASISNAVSAQVNPLLGLKALQFIPPFLNFPNAVESGRKSDTNLSHTLRASFKFSDNLNGYVTHATGFKGSSFNLSTDSRPFPKDFIPG